MRAKHFWKTLPKVDVRADHLKLFWTFVCERQTIWHRRFVLKQPPPWTKDPILRDYKFTNVYRELDHGTIWYRKNVIPLSQTSHLTKYNKKLDLLWLTTMYRLVNRVETFEEVGFIHVWEWGEPEEEKWFRKLEARQKRGECIFTNAHLTLPSHELGSTKLDKYMEVLSDLNKKLLNLNDKVFEARDLETVFNSLQVVKCVGRFIAYEICCDLMLAKAIPFTENDWVNPGPGCKRGINLIWPKSHHVEEYQNDIRWLQSHQEECFERYHLTFHQYHHPLTLRGIEHSLCEFQKYFKMMHKVGKQRMYFKPRDWPNAQGQIPMRFPREK